MSEGSLNTLQTDLTNAFSLEELRTLAFTLGVDWDELSGDRKSAKIHALILYVTQNNLQEAFLAQLSIERPRTIWPRSLPTLPKKPQSRAAHIQQALLDKVRTYWIEGVLENSFHTTARLRLDREYDPDAVERPWLMTMETTAAGQVTIPSAASILSIFEELDGLMLILGAPGSGKTTTLLELCRDLLYAAELDPDQPLPLVFNLSSWLSSTAVLDDWLVDELNMVYQVKKEYAKKWLQEQPFRLLLDGLDEVNPQDRVSCVEAINTFGKNNERTQIVVCSRQAEYEQLPIKLEFEGAIMLQPLTMQQVDQYLQTAGEDFSTVRAMLKADSQLQEMAASPLLLSIMTLAYHGRSPTDLPTASQKDRYRDLFSTYVSSMFERRAERLDFSREQSIHWLAWLAGQMQARYITIFHIESLQADWLPTAQQQESFATQAGLLVGGIFALCLPAILIVLSILLPGLQISNLATVLVPLLCLMPAAWIGGIWLARRNRQINPVETITWSWRDGLKGLAVGILGGLVLWLFSIVIPGFEMDFGFVLATGLIGLLIGGLRGKEIEQKAEPNQGIIRSRTYVTRILLAFALMGLLGGIVMSAAFLFDGFADTAFPTLLAQLLATFFVPILMLLGVGIFISLFFGGVALVKHFLLRRKLEQQNLLPRELILFLDEMADLILLQKVGGGYMFTHQMLLTHFASLHEE